MCTSLAAFALSFALAAAPAQAQAPAAPLSYAGKTALVTGSTDGLGRELALALAFAQRGVTMISLHPATLMDTTMVKGIGIPSRTTVAEGREHVMGLITAPALQPGAFYVRGKPAAPEDAQAGDAQARARLVALSAQLTGVP